MWEFEWCQKYRYKMFRKWKYKKIAEACVRQAASRHGGDFHDDVAVEGAAFAERNFSTVVF